MLMSNGKRSSQHHNRPVKKSSTELLELFDLVDSNLDLASIGAHVHHQTRKKNIISNFFIFEMSLSSSSTFWPVENSSSSSPLTWNRRHSTSKGFRAERRERACNHAHSLSTSSSSFFFCWGWHRQVRQLTLSLSLSADGTPSNNKRRISLLLFSPLSLSLSYSWGREMVIIIKRKKIEM